MKTSQPVHLKPGDIVILGVPSDENSTFMRGSAKAPPLIRKALHCGSSNLFSEFGLDLGKADQFQDIGDLELKNGTEGFGQIVASVSDLVSKDVKPLILGGDHAITYPVLKVIGAKYKNLNILHFDAHPDLYDHFEGNKLAHACPFARIMEEKLAGRLVQVGIRTLNDHQKKQSVRFNTEIIEARDIEANINFNFDGPLYISLDIDVLDPAFAPGISHHEPGGLSVREVLTIIQNIEVPIIGADIVEYNPDRDINDMTAMVAAKFLKELAGKMLT
ncbi:MAG: agmatinase [Deltaproteobacteria bacterium]|jgi:arginase|nr:agmatinase [Deltaproteobacteria bacterium]MBT4526959.1 agmatinase [Deltaproteobacteria bacterium]